MRLTVLKSCGLAAAFWTGLFLAIAHAQSPTVQPSNSLLRLLRSQPQIDVSSPVNATASFDPPVVRPGEKAVYRVRLDALEASIRWPQTITNSSGLSLHASARGQMLRLTGGKYRPLTCFDYDTRASRPGHYSVPAFTVQVYGKPVVIPAARLEVRAGLTGSHEPARQLLLESSATNVYLGQPLTMRVLLPASGLNTLQAVTHVKLNGDGFLVDNNSARQSIKPIERNGRRSAAYIYETEVTPIVAGQITLSAQGFTAGRHFSGPIVIQGRVTIPGGTPDYLLLDSDPVAIHVKPLPTAGQLPGFTGVVGNVKRGSPQVAPATVRVGDPVELSVKILGDGDPSRLVAPPVPRVKNWQAFPGGVHSAGGAAFFTYTLIPLTTSVQATPAIPFSCFNPREGRYVDLTIPSVPLTVRADAGLKTEAWLINSGSQTPASDDTPSLSDLASEPTWTVGSLVPLQLRGWFAWMQLVPGLGFAGIWMWDRRRRHHVAHPELWRRRRARRKLHRERRRLRRAAVRGDRSAFTHSAVTALRIACAPRCSAEADALVCGDVLKALEHNDNRECSEEVVRRCFAALDASSFAASTPPAEDLIPLRAELEQLLVRLEEKL